MINHMAEEIAFLKRKVARLEEQNKQLQSQHDFAFNSWQQAIKRSGRLSADLEETKTKLARATQDFSETRVAPYKTIVVKAKPPPLPAAAYRSKP